MLPKCIFKQCVNHPNSLAGLQTIQTSSKNANNNSPGLNCWCTAGCWPRENKRSIIASPCSPPSPWSTSQFPYHQYVDGLPQTISRMGEPSRRPQLLPVRQHGSSGDEVERTDPVDGHHCRLGVQLTHCLQCVCHAVASDPRRQRILKRGCGMFDSFATAEQFWRLTDESRPLPQYPSLLLLVSATVNRPLRNTLATFSGMSPLANNHPTLKNRCMSRSESNNGLKCSLVIPDGPPAVPLLAQRRFAPNLSSANTNGV